MLSKEKLEGIEIGRRFRCPRVNRGRYTILFRYMALPGPPEIAWPPSKMVVGWTCKRCAGENRPCECISVRSLHQIVPNHPTGMSFSRLCLFLPIPERARPASWPGRISYTWPRLLVAPLSLSLSLAQTEMSDESEPCVDTSVIYCRLSRLGCHSYLDRLLHAFLRARRKRWRFFFANSLRGFI